MTQKRTSYDHDEDYRWFAPSDKGVPTARFEDVTMEIDVGDVDAVEVEIVEAVELDVGDVTAVGEVASPTPTAVALPPPPVLPQPAHRTSTPLPAGARADERFSDLNTILREMRTILTEKNGMSESAVDSVEWQLRTKIANL